MTDHDTAPAVRDKVVYSVIYAHSEIIRCLSYARLAVRATSEADAVARAREYLASVDDIIADIDWRPDDDDTISEDTYLAHVGPMPPDAVMPHTPID